MNRRLRWEISYQGSVDCICGSIQSPGPQERSHEDVESDDQQEEDCDCHNLQAQNARCHNECSLGSLRAGAQYTPNFVFQSSDICLGCKTLEDRIEASMEGQSLERARSQSCSSDEKTYLEHVCGKLPAMTTHHECSREAACSTLVDATEEPAFQAPNDEARPLAAFSLEGGLSFLTNAKLRKDLHH